ncbi:NADH-quinone oxidoreductase subunit M [Orbaceae bacterium ESL0721]|nr:NADH-quinone oxidoreductase subunit M [Orbaceae bacterium ESL0721]
MLLWLIFLPIIGGIIGWLSSLYIRQLSWRIDQPLFWRKVSLWIALATVIATLLIALLLWHEAITQLREGKEWRQEFNIAWIPLLGIRLHLFLDGFSLVMITTTLFVVLLTLCYSRKERPSNAGLFYLCILFMTTSVLMSFVVVDLFLWFFFWEAVAIPLYLLISLWGRRDSSAQLRFNGASKFLIYTQISSLLMLISIISLALINWNLTEHWTFDSQILTKTPISSSVEFFLMVGFLSAIMVRIPCVPLHSWFIEAHIESSTTGSMMISGLLLSTATYGLLRFVIPIFPNASLMITPIILLLSLLTLIYAGLLAFSQTDIKKLIAYINIALMGFITAIIYSGSRLAYQGVVIQNIAINFSMVGMFVISGLLAECYLTRNINQFKGLKDHVRYLSTFTLFFMLVVLGVPGTANFVGNYMMLLGSFNVYTYYTILLVVGLLLVSVSLVIRLQPIFYGAANRTDYNRTSLAKRDIALLVTLLIVLIIIGLYPQFILDITYSSINQITDHLTAVRVGDL